jgi:hypothetical protein
VGTTVFWDASLNGHTVHFDNGAGACALDIVVFPASTVFTAVGTTHIHCDIHSSCGSTNCLGCTGMVMTVNVF